MLKYAQQENNADLRKINTEKENYLVIIERRDQLMSNENYPQQMEHQPIHDASKRTSIQTSQNEPQKFIVINHERLQRIFEELN